MPTPTAWIGLLAGVLTLTWVGLLVFVLPQLPTLPGTLTIPWPLIVAGFLVAEALVVHIQFEREAHSFSLSDIMLVLCLYLADPQELILSQLAGVGIALILIRNQTPLKIVFNLTHFALGTSLAAIVFYVLVPEGDPTGPGGWVAAMAAVLTATVVSNVAILVAISLSDRTMRLRRLARMLALCVPFALGTASLALLGVVGAYSEPFTVLLLAIPAVLVFTAYRTLHRAREQSDNVRLLHDVTRVLYERGDLESALSGFLDATRAAFRAGLAEIVLLGSEDSPARSRSAHDEAALMMEPVDDLYSLLPLLAIPRPAGARAVDEVLGVGPGEYDEAGEGVLVAGQGTRGTGPLDVYAAFRGFKDAMVVLLRSEHRVHGVLIVANRLGEVSSFDDRDRDLLSTLSHHVSSALENGRLETSLVQVTELKERLRYQAFHDPLTGLANRALYFERVQHAVEAAPRTGRWPTVMFMDLDGFKGVNDTLGHDAGDLLLRTVASRLSACLRPGDTAARLGGDEFAAVLENAGDYTEAAAVAERILARMAAPFQVDGTIIPINVSIGVALGTDNPVDAGEITANADAAMYAAKRSGGRRFQVFEGTASGSSSEPGARLGRADLEGAVRRAEFSLQFQPMIHLSTGAPVGAEALVRWQHPTRGLLHPEAFIPLAEETGIIVDIGAFVLREACREAATWPHTAPAGLLISVNISAEQLAHPQLVSHVSLALEEAALDPTRLVLEITETLLMHDRERAESTLWELKQLGVQIAIDDFGTGYSSLAYLRRFPIDMLKIPREFVDGLGRDHNDDVITRAIIDLAATLGLRSVAEGIETAAQQEYVNALNCQLGQGFLFSHPVDAAQVRDYLRRACVATHTGDADLVDAAASPLG